MGNTVPRELILAGGRVPVLVAADAAADADGRDLHGAGDPPETKALFEMAVSGRAGVSRPVGPLAPVRPAVLLPERDLPPGPRGEAAAAAHGRPDAEPARRGPRLQLGTTAGAGRAAGARRRHADSSEASCGAAIELNKRGARRCSGAARACAGPELSGVEAMQVLGAGYFMASWSLR